MVSEALKSRRVDGEAGKDNRVKDRQAGKHTHTQVGRQAGRTAGK